MTRLQLRVLMAGYLHDNSLGAFLDQWIDTGAHRIGQILRCREMETTFQRVTDAPENYIDCGAEFQEVLRVSTPSDGGGSRVLEAVGSHDWLHGAANGGTPWAYYVEGARIYPLPFGNQDYSAVVLARPVVPVVDTDTNAVLTAFGFLFLNAALVEGFDYKQDETLTVRYENKWTAEAQAITRAYEKNRRGEALAMRAC